MSGLGSSADTLNPTIKSVANYKWHWRSLVSVMKGRPQNFFVIWTNAPRWQFSTNASEAALSSAFCRGRRTRLLPVSTPSSGHSQRISSSLISSIFLPALTACSRYSSRADHQTVTPMRPRQHWRPLELVKQVFDAACAYLPAPPSLREARHASRQSAKNRRAVKKQELFHRCPELLCRG